MDGSCVAEEIYLPESGRKKRESFFWTTPVIHRIHLRRANVTPPEASRTLALDDPQRDIMCQAGNRDLTDIGLSRRGARSGVGRR